MIATDRSFQLVTDMTPTGDQPAAIDALVRGVNAGAPHQVLLGATGTGKTFTMANVIERTQKPTLILSHNKTLAAQLYEEMKELFPNNAVAYFVSYYDYYQPEAYIPQRDIYIEKDASRNDDLDRLRLAATSAILSRRDTIVVSSVSCIFGLGSPDAYHNKVVTVRKGDNLDRRKFLLALADMQYKRNDTDLARATYRVKGDVIELHPAYEQYAIRVDLFGDEVDSIALINPTTGEVLADESMIHVFPAVHYVTPEDTMAQAIANIRAELDEQVLHLRSQGKLLEAQRLLARTKYDLEMMAEVGFCSGIENYSRHLDGRAPGEKPFTLLDYFDRAPAMNGSGKGDWLMIIDESHVTMPQIRAMFHGDRNRKQILVDHGFRLPSALDNRPLRFEEFEQSAPRLIYVSATPGPYELEKTRGEIIEQVIRPTGLVDPVLDIKPARGQVADLLEQCRDAVRQNGRVLVTALTKRLCEDLTNYIAQQGVKVRYLHSEIDTLERVEILRELREGLFDVLVGVNLLREGLDLPEVRLVCILDADKTGFLRSPTSLIQTIGRAARNVEGRVILYADAMTPALQFAIEETERRRAKQIAYNTEHGITPETIRKSIRRGIELELKAHRTARQVVATNEEQFEITELVRILEEEMLDAANSLEFERAAKLRDQATSLKKKIEAGATGTITRTAAEKTSERPRKTGRRSGKPRGQ